MSIFQLSSREGSAVDSRYIQTFDLSVENLGEEEFEILIQGENSSGVNLLALHHLSAASAGAGSRLTFNEVPTNFAPFSLQLVSNINDASRTAVTLFAKNNGAVVAIITQQHFSVLD
jgi:hypothetical protein